MPPESSKRLHGQSRTTSAWTGLDDYLAWQQREERLEHQESAAWRELLILNGDPECEQAIAALEQGWDRDKR